MQAMRLVLLIATLAASSAQAALFDDEEARRRVAELKTATEGRFDTQGKALLDLANQLQALREENAKLRGQLETVTYELDLAKKRSQDYYIDLDTRLRKLEPGGLAPAASAPAGAAGAAAPAAPAAEGAAGETQAYEAALSLFKAKKFKDATAALSAFVNNYPDSPLAPNAQYWQGTAWQAQGDCKQAIDAHLVVATRWHESQRAADSMLAIANCQQEMGNGAAARRTLETLVGKYPDAPAAGQARQRLKKK